MNKITGLILLATLSLTACKPGVVFEKHLENKNLLWNRFDVKTFDVEIEDIAATYDFIIAIRHLTDIPYRHIDVYFTLYTPSGEMRTNTYRIPVKDRDGKNLGNGLGELWDLNFPAWDGFSFTEPGICKVEVSSAMSQADLAGVLKVGLIVRKN
jgi:gliding motility-associated lipoprotein GldH